MAGDPVTPLPQAGAANASSAEPGKAGSAAQMAEIKQRILTVDELESRKVLTADSANAQRQYYMDRAAEVAGRPITRHELETWQEREGFFTFLNICLVLAGILGVVAIGWLFGIYLLPLFILVPNQVWQIFVYILCYFLIFGTSTMWTVFPGCLGLIGAVSLTLHLHLKENRNWGTIISAICSLSWSAAALYHGSGLIGFFAILALESLLGFSVLVGPLCVAIGFEDDDVMPRATLASLVLLVAGVVLRGALLLPSGALRPETLSFANTFAPFQTGLIFVGTFVFFTGLLIMSSKWYAKSGMYLLMQLVTVVCGVAAVYVGSVLGIGTLTGIAGTYFGIYILQKYVELPWKSVGYAWSLLGLAGLIYAFVYFAQQNPQYFLFGF
jgi:hypothetical protein